MIEILTPQELAELVRLRSNEVIQIARRGELPFVMLNGKMRFDADDVHEWICARKVGQPPRKLVDVTEQPLKSET